MNLQSIIENIAITGNALPEELNYIITDSSCDNYLFEKADQVRRKIYGTDVYLRGLIEISNYCKNNCLYCGIRKDNLDLERYRLSEENILECCKLGYSLGFRTFVLQGGEDGWYTDDKICHIIYSIKNNHPDCAITLSLGEKTYEAYKSYYAAGADRYLLRHETASRDHYDKLHPKNMDFNKRMECLENLKQIGFQTGAGFMVGSPFQTTENLIADLLFIKNFKPHMVGIGPFIPQSDTPLGNHTTGTLRDTLVMVALTRLLLPNALIPSTTALGTINPKGRELGLKAGANVVMPNLSPTKYRKLYSLYDNKICTGDEAAECRKCLENRVKSAGYNIVTARGDYRA